MFKVSIKPQWTVKRDDQPLLPPRLLDLLVALHKHGSLAEACSRSGQSYRYAWGLLREGQALFGTPLANMTRGKSATLTVLGEKLVWADRRIAARMSPALDSLSSELEVEIERALSSAPSILRIHASHGFAVECLREFLVRGHLPVELKYRASQKAVASLSSGGCDVAGFHIPVGEFETRTLAHYAKWLKPETHVIINIATRRQGLMVANRNPKKIYRLEDLARKDVKFVHRQQGSGTRILLELLLEQVGIDAQQINGFHEGEYTHAAVAAYIASGMADAGFGIETPARQFNLEFIPVATERYFLMCERDSLKLPQIKTMIKILSGQDYRKTVNALPGYDGSVSGTLASLPETFLDMVVA